MQCVLDIDPRAEELLYIHKKLLRFFGYEPELAEDMPRLRPLDQMVRSMIGARTEDSVSWPAFERLRSAFCSWEKCRDAGPARILPHIQDVTCAEDKAKRIAAALSQITARRGTLELDFLESWSVSNALKWLSPLPGVGPKVAAAVLNFSTLNKPAIVLDSHHLRILKRLGFTENMLSTAKAYDLCMSMLPADWKPENYMTHHVLIKRLGQTVCHHRAPACFQCPLRKVCSSFARMSEGAASPAAPSPLTLHEETMPVVARQRPQLQAAFAAAVP